ncbi:ATP-binding protein [Flavilitoribacter nigricans]|uniref:histidine kinase n=1 Tax=Flavilitoribacter nigricans (strain ATCC 23147 / DSM 23189 / NBRC 102662 / NCIMB 1420 / SS-2) TaxID=1122177 RepID=A0A2D0MZQ9_FLAN2|nr:ATP-binding protein [Flavilitoribacter nigricans]PHN01761.1 hypothetical protein CRP01_35325 [Flavilitoribacter nigricans DSM 23189 = NBRC 102662]
MSNTFSLPLWVGLIIWTTALSGQDIQREVDQQWEAYWQQNDQYKQIDILNEISYAYRRVNPDSVLKYADMAISRSEDLNYIRGLAYALKNKGIAYYKLGVHPDTIIQYYEQAIDYAGQVSDYYTQAACLNNIALIQIYNLSYHEAIKSLLKAVDIFDEQIEEDNRLKALILGNLGTAYHAQMELPRSIEYFERALAVGEQLEDKTIAAMYVDELATAKMKSGQTQEAYEDVIRVLPLADELGDMESKASFLITLAEIEGRLLDFESARGHALEALQIAKHHNFTRKIIQALTTLSQGYAETGRIDRAISHAEEALFISREAKMYWYEAKTLLLLSNLSEKKRNYEQTVEYLRQYHLVHERNRDRERQEQTARLEAGYQAKERQNQIELLQQEQIAHKNHIRLLWFATTFFLLLLFVGGYVYFVKWRTSRALNAKNSELANAEQQLYEKNSQLQAYIESNMQLENFAHLASHDLREPMRTIVSFSQLLEKRAAQKLSGDELEYLNFIQEGTRRIEKLINDLLTYAKINNSPASIERVDLNKIISQVRQDLQRLINEKEAVIRVNAPLPESMLSDPARIYQLFQNLITNGIKYCHDDTPPVIDINYHLKNDQHHFSIRDNGIGIAREFYDRIFLLFKTLKNKSLSNSSGIGLATCKKIVEQMGGKIWLESVEEEGSTFYFTLPVHPTQNGLAVRKRLLEEA